MFHKPAPKKMPEKAAASRSGEKSRRRIIIAVAAAVAVAAFGAVFFFQSRAAKQERYETVMAQAAELCGTDAAQAKTLYLEAQSLSPKAAEPYTGYAYALY